MTILLKCAECQQSLTVSEEALGKKVQCPACGASFIGRIDESLPSTTPLTKENAPTSPKAPDSTVSSVGEDKSLTKDKDQPEKKKSRGLLWGCLSAVAFVMLLIGGGGGLFAYRYYTGYIAEGDWTTFSPPNGRCSILLPGEPRATAERPPTGTEYRYKVEKPWAQSQFWLMYFDPRSSTTPDVLDARTDEEAKIQSVNLGVPVAARRSITLGAYEGRELRFSNVAGNRTAILRIYLATNSGRPRLYEVFAEEPNLDVDSEGGNKFFNSFQILNPPPGQPQPEPQRRPRQRQ